MLLNLAERCCVLQKNNSHSAFISLYLFIKTESKYSSSRHLKGMFIFLFLCKYIRKLLNTKYIYINHFESKNVYV